MSKKIVTIIIIIVILIVVGFVYSASTKKANGPEPITQNGEDNIEGWKTYKNFGLEISYPSHWELTESDKLSLENFPTEVRFVGDGYIFIVNPNRGMGSYPLSHYKQSDIYIGDDVVNKLEKINKIESIEPISDYHSLVVTMYRSDSNFFYPFRLNASSDISITEAKEFMSEFLSAIKILGL